MSFSSNKDYSRFPPFARFAHLHFDDLSAKNKNRTKKTAGCRNSARTNSSLSTSLSFSSSSSSSSFSNSRPCVCTYARLLIQTRGVPGGVTSNPASGQWKFMKIWIVRSQAGARRREEREAQSDREHGLKAEFVGKSGNPRNVPAGDTCRVRATACYENSHR